MSPLVAESVWVADLKVQLWAGGEAAAREFAAAAIAAVRERLDPAASLFRADVVALRPRDERDVVRGELVSGFVDRLGRELGAIAHDARLDELRRLIAGRPEALSDARRRVELDVAEVDRLVRGVTALGDDVDHQGLTVSEHGARAKTTLRAAHDSLVEARDELLEVARELAELSS